MAFLLGPALGALGSLLFKEDGGRISTPAMKSSRLAEMTGKSNMVSQPYMKSFPKTKVQKKRKVEKLRNKNTPFFSNHYIYNNNNADTI